MSFFHKNREEKCKFKKNETCEIFNSYESLSTLKKTELIIDVFKIKWGKWTIKIISWGLIIIFITAIMDYFLKNRDLSIELKIFGALQIWVGFALGIIAMLFSIISMYLSFYNLELQKDTEKNNLETFNSLKNNIVNEIRKDVITELKAINKDMLNHFGNLEKITEETRNKVDESVKNKITKEENPRIKKLYNKDEG
ncbi:hypothetical protein [Fusobacterium sp.]|uniref:hypothetical protein n=1 Tax=Fusobacterium sp. TaxID=68766 RepID=UPI0026399A02|nr:hypothetical protein [Fusobacterium sp.]